MNQYCNATGTALDLYPGPRTDNGLCFTTLVNTPGHFALGFAAPMLSWQIMTIETLSNLKSYSCSFTPGAAPADYAREGLTHRYPCTGMNYVDELVVWAQLSSRPNRLNVCVAPASNLSGGVCYRADRLGNIDADNNPRVQL